VTGEVVYLYGFVPADASEPDDLVSGIDGRDVTVLDLGPFGAAVTRLDSQRFGEGAIEAQLKDLGWVARHGARHETVVTWFSDVSNIVPSRLFTVFSSEEALRSEATLQQSAIVDRLRRCERVREWDLKVSYELDVFRHHLAELSPETAAMEEKMEAAAPGRRYLLERKHEDLVAREARLAATTIARDLLDELGKLADEVAELELPALREDSTVVLKAALLVPRAATSELKRTGAERTGALEQKGLRGELTGPWAPYRFVGGGSDA